MPSRHLLFTVCFAVLQTCLVGALDYVTSYQVSVGVLYYGPIAYAAWNVGGWASFGFGALCCATMTWAEIASGFHYPSGWILAERSMMRLIAFCFVAFSFNYFKRSTERDQRKICQLEGLLTFCTSCRKVHDNQDNWVGLDAYLRENPSLSRSKLCPTCARAEFAATGKRSI